MTQRCRESFSFDLHGVPVPVSRGELYDDDDPFVKSHPTQFEPADDAVVRTSPARAVETATAAPGSARTISRHDRRAQRGTADGKSEE